MSKKLSENFNLSEFESKDGMPTPVDALVNLTELAENLQVVRDFVNKPLKVLSGYRSPEHNAKVGGVKNSQHLLGKAADLRPPKGMTTGQLARVIKGLIRIGAIRQGGVGVYGTFVHYDIRGVKARWDKR